MIVTEKDSKKQRCAESSNDIEHKSQIRANVFQVFVIMYEHWRY